MAQNAGRRKRLCVTTLAAVVVLGTLSGCMFVDRPAPQYQVSLGQVGTEAVFRLCESLTFDRLEFAQRNLDEDWEDVWSYFGSEVDLAAGSLLTSSLAHELGFETPSAPREVDSDGSFSILAFSGDDVVLDAYFQPSATISPSREWVRGDGSVGLEPCIVPSTSGDPKRQ